MDIEKIKIEPPIVVKDEINNSKNDEKTQHFVEFSSEENKPSTSELVQNGVSRLDEKPLHTCCYCGEQRESKEMAQTPGTYKEFLKWSQILGQRIYNNFITVSMVCRSHFNDENGKSRLVDVVCGNVVVETKLCDKSKCCYCGKSIMKKLLTMVPSDKFHFDEWAKILGKQFRDHFEKRKHGFICRSHFDVEWQGPRPKDVLPVADFNENLVPVPDEDLTKTIVSGRKNTCAYCEEWKSYHELTKLPQNPNTVKKWAEILGEEFYKRSSTKKTAYICRSHFNAKWKTIRPHTLLPCVKLLANEVKEENLESMQQENFTIQDGPSDTKRIKLEIKEEIKKEI